MLGVSPRLTFLVLFGFTHSEYQHHQGLAIHFQVAEMKVLKEGVGVSVCYFIPRKCSFFFLLGCLACSNSELSAVTVDYSDVW